MSKGPGIIASTVTGIIAGIVVCTLLAPGCGGSAPPAGADAAPGPDGCAGDQVAPAAGRTVSCDGHTLTLPAVFCCTPIDRYILDVIVANAELFQALSAEQAIELYATCVADG